MLDVGCGSGALVAALRSEGIEAYGLELTGERIEVALLAAARPHVTLYDGSLPLPWPPRSVESVVCTEVLEHIVGFEALVTELYRVARRAVLVTVPDCSAIPRGHAHFVVPWHLLESTHVNFFTQQSLERSLREGAETIEFARVGEVRCDSMTFYTSLAALVSLRRPATEQADGQTAGMGTLPDGRRRSAFDGARVQRAERLDAGQPD